MKYRTLLCGTGHYYLCTAEAPDTPVHWAVRSTHVQDRGYTAHGKDTPDKPLEGTGPKVRLVVATHTVTSSPPKLASSATKSSTSCLSAPFLRWRLPPRMCSTSTCTEDRLRRLLPMKTWNWPRIGGTPIRRVARSFAKSSRSGCGTCA